MSLNSHHLYGSSRLGTKDYLSGQIYRLRDYTGTTPIIDTIHMATRKPWYSMEYNDAINSLSVSPYGNTQKGSYRLERLLGMKQYELTNHLGNVQTTITDYPVAVTGTQEGYIMGKRPALASPYDYYPFGMLMPGRYISDTVSKCLTISQKRWVNNPSTTYFTRSTWTWPGLLTTGVASVSVGQLVSTSTAAGASVSFAFEASLTLTYNA